MNSHHTRPCSSPLQSHAFTLAEVLITLVIVGVVAALTIPVTVAKYHEQQTIQSLKRALSTFAQAVKMAESNNGPIETWDIGPGDSQEGSLKLYNLIVPYLSLAKECKENSGCFGNNYKTLQGTNGAYQPDTWNRYIRGILNNGVPFYIWSNGSGCYSETYGSKNCGVIRVDINGDSKPNRYGYDFFSFDITKNGLLPAGKVNSEIEKTCNFSGSHVENGIDCTAWVLYKNNFDYKKQNISW